MDTQRLTRFPTCRIPSLLVVLMLAVVTVGCGENGTTWMSQPTEEFQLATLLEPVLGTNEPAVKVNTKGQREVTVIVHRDDLDAPNLEETAQEAVTVIAEDYEHAGTIRDLEIRFQSGFDIGIFKSIAMKPFTFSQEDIQAKDSQTEDIQTNASANSAS